MYPLGRAVRRYHALRAHSYHWAFISMQHDDEHSAATYAEYRRRGHTHGRALRGVADRLMRTLIAMLRSRTLYDPQLARRSSRTVAAVGLAAHAEATP